MIRWTKRQGCKELRVLVLRVHPFRKEVIKRFEECNRNEELCLRIAFGIDDRVTETELQILTGNESEHIRRHELIMGTIVDLGAIFGVALYVVIRRVDYVTGQPRMKIIELEPLARRQLQRQHRNCRIVGREDVRAMLCVTPLDTFTLNAYTTPPHVERDSASHI